VNVPQEILKRARSILEPSGVWIKYYYAKNEHDRETHPCAKDAIRFDITGAVILAEHELGYREVANSSDLQSDQYFVAAIEHLHKTCGRRYIQQFNDQVDVEHQDILKWLDRAIERAGEVTTATA